LNHQTNSRWPFVFFRCFKYCAPWASIWLYDR